MPSVLVLRPEPANHRTCTHIRRLGPLWTALSWPLFKIFPLTIDIPQAHRCAALILTSQNALSFLSESSRSMLKKIPCFAVGTQTAKTAQKYGLPLAWHGHNAAKDMIPVLHKTFANHDSLLYLCGRNRRMDFEDSAKKIGLNLCIFETYDARPIMYSQDEIPAFMKQDSIDFILFYSQNSAHYFIRLTQNYPLHAVDRKTCFLCFSESIAEIVQKAGYSYLDVAPIPSETALRAKLRAKLRASLPQGD